MHHRPANNGGFGFFCPFNDGIKRFFRVTFQCEVMKRRWPIQVVLRPGRAGAIFLFGIVHQNQFVVARAKALDMARRGYAAHADPDGYGSNKACELAGWVFPSWYDNWIGGNNIESLTGGSTSAAGAFSNWLKSDAHQAHLFGLGGFSLQTRYGFGHAYVPGTTYVNYYVFLSAPPKPSGVESLEPYVEWLFDRYTLKVMDLEGDGFDRDGDGISRIVEFAMDLDPEVMDVLPAPKLTDHNSKLEWTLSIRPDLGSMQAVVKQSQDLASWSQDGVSRSGNIFQVETNAARVFLRLECAR